MSRSMRRRYWTEQVLTGLAILGTLACALFG
jgi:hypothetical protein